MTGRGVWPANWPTFLDESWTLEPWQVEWFRLFALHRQAPALAPFPTVPRPCQVRRAWGITFPEPRRRLPLGSWRG